MNERMKKDQRRSAENANYFYHIILKHKSLLTRAANALEAEHYRFPGLIQELRDAAK